ncbi:MAG: hypothetical protein H6745_33135 [Deltaproteobacteria bacterium]|nr:hypothetical protein [Deltaproteobacteria bacterium]
MCEKAQSATSSSPVAPETATFGRGPELARLGAWLDGGERLVTVMGGGGIGKTRLASELARARRGGAEVVFVALGEARDALDAMSAVARELDAGIGGAGLEQLGRGVGRALRARGPLLLVLDGLERVVAPLAPFIDGWLDVAPDAQLLVTSRERLLVPGERVLIVPPLAVGADARGPAVALFRARAATAGAEVAAWDDAEQRALVELVSRLDGLPLAIELAAARAASAPPSRLLVELERRFEVLGPAAGDARAPGMEEVLEASWAPLPADAKDALARLSVLASPFDLEAAAAVLGRDELAALDLDALLRRRSLVVAGRAPGDLQLLETVRDFARARAGAAGLDVEDDAVRRRDDWVLGGPRRSRRAARA